MKRLLFATLFLASSFSFAQVVQETFQQAKITYTEKGDLTKLLDLGLPVDHGQHKVGYYVISEFSTSELAIARQNGYKVDVLIEDSKEYFLEQNRNPQRQPVRNPSCGTGGETVYETPDNFELGSMGGYLTYSEMLSELDQMKALYPNLITTKANISNFLTEGQPDNSVSPSIGGNGIKWVKISDNPNANNEGEPQILHTAIHHAREPASLSQLIFYMWYLLENYDTSAEVQSIVNNTELYFVPVINVDGYLYNEKTDPNGGGFWRKNRKGGHGVDNNRNYDYYVNGNSSNGVWGGEGTSGNTGSEVYRGTAPFSEVENQAIKWFVEQHDFVMAFNNHTSGNLLLYPYGYANNVPTPEDLLFQQISGELVSRNGFTNQISADLYPAAGDSDDFMYGSIGTHDKIYAFTPEIGPSFWPGSGQIEGICKSMMYLNITAAKMVNNYASIDDTAPLYTGSLATATATFDIKRLGISGAGNFTVNVNPVSSNIISAGASMTFSGLAILEEDSGSIPFTIAGGTQAGADLVYELVVNNGSYDSKITVTKKFGTLDSIFLDEGDSVSDNFDNNGWGVINGVHAPDSPSSSITDSPSGNYSNNSNKSITLSEAIDLTDASGANVTFFAKWEIENDYDYVQFEVSTNSGGSWTAQCGNYTNAGSGNNSQPTGEPLYDGTQAQWVKEEIDLSDYLGESIIIRYVLSSDGAQTGDGFYFDDLEFNIAEEGTLSNEDALASQFVVYPNPVKNILNITTPLDNYTIELYSIQGQLVNTQANNSGSQTLDYSYLANGMYLLKLTSANASQTLKIVKQ